MSLPGGTRPSRRYQMPSCEVVCSVVLGARLATGDWGQEACGMWPPSHIFTAGAKLLGMRDACVPKTQEEVLLYY
eukprot:scaffold150391_cov39-Tisochrysis_lutea.AAC.2